MITGITPKLPQEQSKSSEEIEIDNRISELKEIVSEIEGTIEAIDSLIERRNKLMLFVAIFLYVFSGQVVLEKLAYQTLEECQAKGQVRATELAKDPRFDGGLYAQCVPLPGKLAKN